MISGSPRAMSAARKQHAFGILEACAFGQIDHDRDLGLVVERQQLDGDGLGREQRHRQQRRDADADQEDPGRSACCARSGWRCAGRGARARLRHARHERQPRRPAFGASRSISQGATTMATKNENSMAADALAGIGAM